MVDKGSAFRRCRTGLACFAYDGFPHFGCCTVCCGGAGFVYSKQTPHFVLTPCSCHRGICIYPVAACFTVREYGERSECFGGRLVWRTSRTHRFCTKYV